MNSLFRPALMLFVALSIATGIVYPLAVTGLAQLLLPQRANGSLIEKNGKLAGSELIGQPFSDAKYFWPRPSATAPFANNPGASSGSNLGPTNAALTDAAKQRIGALRAADATASMDGQTVPVDLVTASGSGLDPQISPAAARFQVARVAHARGLAEEVVMQLVAQATQGRQFGVLGEPRVNVLTLNLALDALSR